jgi:DNA-binding transcriptional ArsR family regulator
MNKPTQKTLRPTLLWDWGTAYDLFVSLMALHEPSHFGLRAAWAAGMRSRLPAPARETLEALQQTPFDSVPYPWISRLPDPKDGWTAINALAQVPPADRLLELTRWPGMPDSIGQILRRTTATGSWVEADVQVLQALLTEMEEEKHAKPERLAATLEWFARAEESGERLLSALRAYQEVFFAEEESRIRPALQRALERARRLAEELEPRDLLEQLSEGVRLDEGFEAPEIVLAPSYWATPLLIFGQVSEQRGVILFGARPKQDSLVPGEAVPEATLRALKALSDPTRLRILRYLAEEPLTPTQLSQRLRLRTSTVVHHLLQLRLATLVQLSIGGGKEKRYSTRTAAVEQIFAGLEGFLKVDGEGGGLEQIEAELTAEGI